MDTLDLSNLEQIAGFRSDLLFFIRLAGTHAQTIFWNACPKGSATRTKMLQLAEQVITDPNLKAAICNPAIRGNASADLLEAGFIKLLRQFDEDMQKTFTTRLKDDYAIFLRFDEFVAALDLLRDKRGWLEHYEERLRKKAPKLDDTRVFAALGIFLLPELCGLLEGRMSYWSGRIAAPDAAAIHATRRIFIRSKQDRKTSLKAWSDNWRRRTNMARQKRKALVSENQPWRRAYAALCTSSTDYRESEFKLRYTFIGQQNIREIARCLGSSLTYVGKTPVYEGPDTRRLNFRLDIEPFYMLAMKMGLRIHRFLELLPKKDKDQQGKPTNPVLRAIRNEIAHNGLFWRVKILPEDTSCLPVRGVFAALLGALHREDALAFCDQIESLLRKENYAVLHTKGEPPKAERVRRWTETRRAQTKAEGVHLTRRKAVRAFAASWLRDLQRAAQTMPGKGFKHAGKNAI